MDSPLDTTSPISLDTTPVQPTVSLDTGGNTDNYLMSPELIAKRAFKISYALDGTNAQKPPEDINSALQQGNEASVRTEAANALDAKTTSDRSDLIAQTVAKKQGPLTPEDMKNIDLASGFNFPYTYPTDPQSVIEQNYGKAYVSEFDKFAQKLPDTNFWNYGQLVARNDIEAAQIFGNVVTAQNQYLITQMQRVQAKIDAQSSVGYGADFAKSAFPILNPYYELKMRGNVPGVSSWAGGLLGENLDRQRIALQAMPFDQYTATINNYVNTHGDENPQQVLAWLTAMQGQSSSEKALNSLNTIGHVFDVPIVFSIGKTVFTKGALLADTRTAMKTALKASNTVDATKAEILTSVGNTTDAGLQSATKILAERVKGTASPTEDALATLPDNFNVFKRDIESAPHLSQTHQNILLEATEGDTVAALKVLANTVRPTEVNLENITGNVLYQVQKTIVDRYPGENNSILRLSYPIIEPISKKWYSEVWWGKNAGDMFDNYHEAADSLINKGFRVSYDAEHLAELDARIADVKASIKEGPSMHDDTSGLNYFDTLPDTLKTMEAKRAAVSKSGGMTIGQQGLKFYGKKIDFYDMRDKPLLELTSSPDNPLAVSPDSWTKYIPFLNHFRTAEDTFSVEHSANRKAAVFPQEVFNKMVSKDGALLSDFFRGKTKFDPITGEKNPFWKQGIPIVRGFMNKGRVKDLNTVLDYSQKHIIDPDTNVPGGYFTPTELNDFYVRTFQRPATFEETQAYEAIKRWHELERVWTQVQVTRGQARRGAEMHTIITKAPDGSTMRSKEFAGTVKGKFGKPKGNMLVMGEDLKTSAVKDLDFMSNKVRDEYADLVRSGTHKFIEVDDSTQFPFKDFGVKKGESLIDYVLAPNVETSALKWNTVPRRGGGHLVYDYAHYIKQPIIQVDNIDGHRKTNYLGDNTIAPVAYHSIGKDVANKFNVVRRLLKDGKEVEAKASYINNGLEGALEPWQKFRAKFDRYKDPDGVWHNPVYNMEEDAHVVPKNKSVADMPASDLLKKYGPYATDDRLRNTWNDATYNSPARAFQVKFTGQRDAMNVEAIENMGTVDKPVYQRTPAQLVNPLVMLNRGMSTSIRSLFMDDYKIYAVNSWLKEAITSLKEDARVVWSSPMGTFRTITRDSFKPGTGQEEINRLLANHYKIEQLVGTPTVLDTFAYSVAQNLADAAYNKLGPTAASYITPQWLIHKLRDPFSFLRSVAFNAYMGVFSVPQIFVQSMNYVNMFAIAPKYASQGSIGVYLHYLSRFNKNPEILDLFDRIATKFGYKPGEWLEAMQELENTGFNHVGLSHGMMDNMHRYNPIKSGGETFLEWGRKPFQWGEQNSRIGAWYIAMKEFRDLNPGGKLSDMDKSLVLNKADFYQGNMSSASKSMINSGVFSLPAQFYIYSTRLAEIFWSGTRLGGTLMERNLARARLVAVNGLMFGVPMAAGITGLPVADYLRKELLDSGYPGSNAPYVVGKNFIESMINEGVIAGGIAAATGKWMNVGPREGLGGVSPLKDVLTGDAKFWKIVGGASGTFTMNTWNNGMYPLLATVFSGDFKNVKWSDLYDNFKEYQNISALGSWWIAMNTGKWVNKNSDFISDVDKAQATAMYLTGLRESSMTDVFNKETVIKERDAVVKYALKQFTLNMNRAILARSIRDDDQAQAYRDKAVSWLPSSDFPSEKLGHAFAQAFKGSESLIDRIDKEFYLQKAPPSQKDKLRKAYEYVKQHRGQ